MLTYSFSKIGSESLYMYLYKCIREDILTGKITPGTKLPSKRSFAENLGVSVITVENAYAQLVSEGYVYALPKKGFFAANLEKSTAPQKKESPRTQMPVPPKYFADFSSSRTDPQNFPFATWAKLMREIISEKSAELMVNAPCGGVFELRCAIAEHLREFRGIDADPNCIVVGAGTEYLYGLLIQLLGFDKVYALEDPGYRKIAQVYESYGVQYRFTPMDKEGIDPKALEKSGADILHISPSHHFPTGIVVSSQVERSHFQNLENCKSMLRAKLAEIKEREHLEKISDIKGVQQKIEWGSQIRSYVFMPYTLAKDTRTGYEMGNIGAVMDGDLDGFINAYLKALSLGQI